MKRIYYNFQNLSRYERDMIMHIIDIIEELRSERNYIYAFLEAVGIVNDHLDHCFRKQEVSQMGKGE